MKKSTGELLDILKKTPDFPSYAASVSDNFIEKSAPHTALNALLKEKCLKKSEVIKRSGLDRKYAYEILSGKKKPARDKILALCLSMQLSIEETQRLLITSGYPQLYAKVERESVILFALQNHLSVLETNEHLDEMGLGILE
ncbi:MAG: hypothetical protein NC321_12790 [Clostridium sp.]|nr:hypothetical protein [Clostridium sp.]